MAARSFLHASFVARRSNNRDEPTRRKKPTAAIGSIPRARWKALATLYIPFLRASFAAGLALSSTAAARLSPAAPPRRRVAACCGLLRFVAVRCGLLRLVVSCAAPLRHAPPAPNGARVPRRYRRRPGRRVGPRRLRVTAVTRRCQCDRRGDIVDAAPRGLPPAPGPEEALRLALPWSGGKQVPAQEY